MPAPVSRTPVLLALMGLLIVLGLPAGAGAADPIPTATRLTMTGDREPGGDILLIARVSSESGVPTGSVTFTGSTFATVTVPLDAEGIARTQVVAPTVDLDAVATFVGTGGYGNSADDNTWRLPDSTAWKPQPTLLKLGGPLGLSLTLTFATTVTNKYGAPKVGVPVRFSLLGPYPWLYDPNRRGAIAVCAAVTDARGFATCKGSALIGAVVSILTGGAWATLFEGPFATTENVHLPVVSG